MPDMDGNFFRNRLKKSYLTNKMVDIIFVLDESYSMISHITSYINGINSFISTQKRVNPTSRFTLVKFNSVIYTLCKDLEVHTLSEFTRDHYKPTELTALYDAIGYSIDIKYDNKPSPTIMIILTDGIDNMSKKYSLKTIRDRIAYMEERGWLFVFVASNQDASSIGQKMGIHTCITYNETSKSISHVADACNVAVGHAMYKWTGVPNEFCQQEIPSDVRDLADELSNFSL